MARTARIIRAVETNIVVFDGESGFITLTAQQGYRIFGTVRTNGVGAEDVTVMVTKTNGDEIGDDIVFDNTDTGGGSARAKVSVVNGGFTQEESTSTEEDHLILIFYFFHLFLNGVK